MEGTVHSFPSVGFTVPTSIGNTSACTEALGFVQPAVASTGVRLAAKPDRPGKANAAATAFAQKTPIAPPYPPWCARYGSAAGAHAMFPSRG